MDKYNFDLDGPLEEISKKGGEKLPSHFAHALFLNTREKTQAKKMPQDFRGVTTTFKRKNEKC